MVEGKDFHDVNIQARLLSFPDVYKCGLCQSEKLYLRSYTTEKEKYEYDKIVCSNCKASLTLGKAKIDGAAFLRKKENGSYDWQESKEDNTPQKQGAPPEPEEYDSSAESPELPF